MTSEVQHWINADSARRTHTLLYIDRRYPWPSCQICRRAHRMFAEGRRGKRIHSFSLPYHPSVCSSCYVRYQVARNRWHGPTSPRAGRPQGFKLTGDEQRDRQRKASRAYYYAHKEQIKANNRAHYHAHKEQVKVRNRAYYHAHKEQDSLKETLLKEQT